jgi:hypothetical protein
MKICEKLSNLFFIMYFGYLLEPPPPLCGLAGPAEWGFEYMFYYWAGQGDVILYDDYKMNS